MRNALLMVVLVGTSVAWAWLFMISDGSVRGSLGLLALAFAIGSAGALVRHYRARLTTRVLTSGLALGSLLHASFAGLVVAGDRVGELGLLPSLSPQGGAFVVGMLGLAAAFASWTRTPANAAKKGVAPAPLPPASAASVSRVAMDWNQAEERLVDDAVRLRVVQGLRRAVELCENDPEQATRWLEQEARRVASEGAAAAKEEDDVLSQAASLLEWGAQKLPELAELDVADLLMGKVIADIRAQSDRVERIFVDHRELHPIHPISRQTAEDKCDARAAAAREALPLLESNGMRLSEDLIASETSLEAFQSVTGFQVVHMGESDGYVTFEGNGRREGLLRAFPETAVEVEVRHYLFDDPEVVKTIRRRVDRVRRWKGLA